MSNQKNPNNYQMSISVPLEDVAKLRLLIVGKVYPAPKIGNRENRKNFREMSLSAMVAEAIHEMVVKTRLTKEARKWIAEKLVITKERRRLADEKVKAGYFRQGGKSVAR